MAMLDALELARKLTVKAVAWGGLGLSAGLLVMCLGLMPTVHPGFERKDSHEADIGKVENEIMQNAAQIMGIHSYQDRHQALDDAKSILQLKAQECGLPKDAPVDVYRETILGLNDECKRLGGTACDIPACGNL